MKLCCKCKKEFETPGIQCIPCRDKIYPPKREPNQIPDDSSLPIQLVAAIMMARERRK
jgi:DNA-directed RNA polymerase subunit RPC12/RpoP